MKTIQYHIIVLSAVAVLAIGLSSCPSAGSGESTVPKIDFVFVSNSGDYWDIGDTVSVIAVASNTVHKTITVGANPRGLDGTPDGELVFVANRNDDTLSVIDTNSMSVIKTMALTGDQPYNVEVTPDGTTVYVAMKTTEGGDTGTPGVVSIVDVASLTETGTITLVGESPEGIAISPDGSLVYIVFRESGTVDVISTANNTVIDSIVSDGSYLRDAVVIGSRLFVVDDSSPGVYVYDTSTLLEVTNIPGFSSRDIAKSPDGAKAYATTMYGDSLKVIDVGTNTVDNTISLTGSYSYGVGVTRDGTRAYVSMSSWPGYVAVVDLVNGVELIAPIDVGDEPRHLKVVGVPESF